MMANFVCQFDGHMCPAIWANIILAESAWGYLGMRLMIKYVFGVVKTWAAQNKLIPFWTKGLR